MYKSKIMKYKNINSKIMKKNKGKIQLKKITYTRFVKSDYIF